MTAPITIHVEGTPAPQGSKRAFVVNGRAVITEDSKKTRPWREDVRQAAISEMAGEAPLDGPIALWVDFYLPKPKSVKRPYPSVRPDSDKLARAFCDALTSAGVYKDDSQVVDLTVTKRYGDRPGATAYVRILDDPDD